ncbi:RNA polymerase sigma factor [Xanthomarina sp. F2636L]|uniref:RNA polymerase sigma factor n=1 Tax=Xanthomarina sp. F2636L TaxID=2996018 RepID=UPI00225E663D|nr:sigma-70 family RNA polymerase sigma factor [Xanthomarina sp. F2636L]MCX7550802.1 sigma-70 family RNA polymerase sigma factor [Xanthomarina sp. F2636L]
MNTKTDSTQIIELIKINDEGVLKTLYQSNFYKIEAFVLKNSGTTEHAKDIFQEAFIAVWKNVKTNKFQPQNNHSLNGYLYTISKNKWMDYLRSKHHKKTVVTSKLNHFQISNTDSLDKHDDILKENRLQDIMEAFKNLGLPCKNLLTKFYFEKKSMNTIAEELQLDAASTRNKKYRCMQKLRELALKDN